MRVLEVEVTGGNIRQGHFYINRDAGLIPVSCWGGNNKLISGEKVSLQYEGDSEVIETDFDGKKRIPRIGRGKCKAFFRRYDIKPGDKIHLIKKSDLHYLVSPVR